MGRHQSGPVQQVAPFITDRSDKSHQRPGKTPIPRMEYNIKEKKEESKPVADVEKLKAADVVQIGDMKVAIKDAGKELMVIEKSVDVPMQRPVMAMIMRPGAVRAQQTSTTNLGGVLQAYLTQKIGSCSAFAIRRRRNRKQKR